MLRRLAVSVSVFSAACAAPPMRAPLPIPYLPVRGAVPAPGTGPAAGLTWGMSVNGPELKSSTLFGGGLGVGFRKVASFWYNGARTADRREAGRDDASVAGASLKVLVARPFGYKSALAVHGASYWGQRMVEDYDYQSQQPGLQLQRVRFQDDRIRTYEAALPLEFLLDQAYHQFVEFTSVFVGPRLTYVSHSDAVRSDGTFRLVIPGVMAGFRTSAGPVDLVLEATGIYVPRHAFNNGVYGGYITVMPSVTASVHFGQPFDW